MIGKQKSQLSLLDSAFNARTKRSRAEKLLKKIDKFIDWDNLESICRGMYKDTKRGRPSLPIIISLKCLVLQYLYNLSDPALEDALIDRLSFQRFLNISFDTELPDFTTIWRFRERLIKADLLDEIFTSILQQLDKRNLILRKGTLVDATLVQAARRKVKNKSTRDGNGKRSSQEDHDASGTQKGGKQYYGYKGHIAADDGSNIIRRRRFTTASVHDSREFNNLICGDERYVFADKAYADDTIKRNMREKASIMALWTRADEGAQNSLQSKRRQMPGKRKYEMLLKDHLLTSRNIWGSGL